MKNNKIYQGLSTLEVLEGADNYNRWIAESLKKYTLSPIIELGAGTGNISDYFLNTKDFTITEFDANLVEHLKKKYKKKNIRITRLDLAGSILPPLVGSYKSAFAVNVFEHIRDDDKALKNAYTLLEDKGVLVLLVPAKKFAYTRLDKNLGHFRRYEPDELRKKLQSAGFEIEELKYFNAVGLLSWILRDRIEKQHHKLDRSKIALFDKIVPLLRRVENVIPPPVGISLIAVARKK